MGKKNVFKVHAEEVVPPRSAVNQLMGLYIVISFSIALAWLLGTLAVSFLWVFAIIFGLFIVWKTRLRDIVERNLDWHKELFHRKRALRQEETAEWLNFIINRWWVFSAISIEDLVKRRINDRLINVKPSFIDHLELVGFTFGDITPSVRSVKVFECPDGVPGFKPASWSNITQPPVGLDRFSTFRVVVEAAMVTRCEDFRMVFRARVGSKRVGLDFDVAVEEMQIKGTLQIVLHMSMEVPFPHITTATLSFTDIPEVWFNVKVLKSLDLMEVPLLRSWIHINVMEGITKALVDPGKVDIPIAKLGPINANQFIPKKKFPEAQGVLTIIIKGTPPISAGEDICYTRLRVGQLKRQTVEVPATQSWEDCCSFFVYDLAKDKLTIKNKCKRLLTTVTLEQHCLELNSFPFQCTKIVSHEIENRDGSRLSLQLDYTPLAPINLLEQEPVNVLQKSGVVYVCVHCANKVMPSDKTGLSDPYCVVFCDRRRVLTTPYISQTLNPSWEASVEFFVKDFTQCYLSFYVFDWDGTNTIDDDYLGSANLTLSEKEPSIIHKALTLGFNKLGQGHISDLSLGQITVSVVFRPVPSVERSERYRLTSTDTVNNNDEFLYTEDMVSPGTMGGGRKLSKVNSVKVKNEDILEDKIFIDLTIIQAKDLVPMDRNGYSDPFCEVKMNDVKLFSTSVKKKTLNPFWNEEVTFQTTEECGMLEFHLYDKDILSKDFLGKLSLTLDQLKELSLKGTSDWFPLQHTSSGQLQLKCVVTARDTLKHGSNRLGSGRVPSRSSRDVSPVARPVLRETSLENDVFVPTQSKQLQLSPVQPSKHEKDNGSIPPFETPIKGDDTLDANTNALQPTMTRMPKTSTPLKKDDATVPLRRSASDVNMERKSRSNSLNSFHALPGMDLSTVLPDPSQGEDDILGVSSLNQADILGDRLYNVTGKVLGVQGLKLHEGHIYCKVRALSPHKHRLRQIFGNRVIAKSPLVKACQPVFNMPFDIDRGMGVSGETMLKLDIKRDGKETLASRSFHIKSLFSGPGGEADKIQKVLTLENNIQVEVYLQHSPTDSNAFLRRRAGGRHSSASHSQRKH